MRIPAATHSWKDMVSAPRIEGGALTANVSCRWTVTAVIRLTSLQYRPARQDSQHPFMYRPRLIARTMVLILTPILRS